MSFFIKLASTLFIALIFSANAIADTYVHEWTGLRFEDEVAGLIKTEIINFENTKAGHGVGVNYKSNGKALTVYIYNLRYEKLADDPNDSIFVENYKKSIEEIFARYPNAKLHGVTTLPKNNLRRTAWILSFFDIEGAEGVSKSYLITTTYKNFFVKIRYSFDRRIDKSGEESGGDFLEYVSKQIN